MFASAKAFKLHGHSFSGCPQPAYSIYSQLSSVSSVRNLRARHAVVTRNTLIWPKIA